MNEVSGSGQAYWVIKMRNASKADAWRALNASAGFTGSYAPICIAVDEDIDIHDSSMVNWRSVSTLGRKKPILLPKESPRAWILPLIGLVWKALKYAWRRSARC
jgi:3-polyprenyl-4-hydroxybenzoate decarboxylase